MRGALIIGLGLVFWPAVGQAQVPDMTVAPREILLGQARPFAVASRRPSFAEGHVFSFYVSWDRARDDGGTRSLVIRRAALPLAGDTAAEPDIDWADSRNCPGLEEAIVQMEAISLPVIDVPAYGIEYPLVVTADGVIYELWSDYAAWGDRTAYGVTLSSNTGTPLANWTEAVHRAAEPCWSTETPQTVDWRRRRTG